MLISMAAAMGDETDDVKDGRKTHAIVAYRIRRRIVRGELVEGQQLPPEEELTAQFGVARTTLREALRVLESQGLITIRRGRGGGPTVTHPSLEPVSTAASPSSSGPRSATSTRRRLIETEVAGARPPSTDEDLVALQAAVDRASAPPARDSLAFGLAAAGVHATWSTVGESTTTLSGCWTTWSGRTTPRTPTSTSASCAGPSWLREAARPHPGRRRRGAGAHWEARCATRSASAPDQPLSTPTTDPEAEAHRSYEGHRHARGCGCAGARPTGTSEGDDAQDGLDVVADEADVAEEVAQRGHPDGPQQRRGL